MKLLDPPNGHPWMIQIWIFLMYAGRFDHLVEPGFHFLSEC